MKKFIFDLINGLSVARYESKTPSGVGITPLYTDREERKDLIGVGIVTSAADWALNWRPLNSKNKKRLVIELFTETEKFRKPHWW